MDHAIHNFKYMSSDQYRLYRMLRTPGSMREFYKTQIDKLGKISGAVIFPEQFLSIQGHPVTSVSYVFSQNGFNLCVGSYKSAFLTTSDNGTIIRNVDGIFEYEENTKATTHPYKIFVTDNENCKIEEVERRSRLFTEGKLYFGLDNYWFTNKRAALSFVKQKLLK